MYDEKSDVFSFAVIMWRLFGSKQQNKDEGDSQPQPQQHVQNGTNDAQEAKEQRAFHEEESAFLKVNNKVPPPPAQREIIRMVSASFISH